MPGIVWNSFCSASLVRNGEAFSLPKLGGDRMDADAHRRFHEDWLDRWLIERSSCLRADLGTTT
jgi:hypothetical protein